MVAAMALSVDWPTKVITVPQADLTDLGGGVYELDLDTFRLELKSIEASAEGMPFEDMHSHNPPVTVAGVTLQRVVEIINGFSVTFEDGTYAVNLAGANSNVADVANVNQVSIRAFNSAGAIQITSGSGLSAAQDARLIMLEKILRNRLITDPETGAITVYDDDNVTPFLSAALWEDAQRTQPYRGQGAECRERLE